VFEADIEACFDELSHSAIIGRVRRRVGDKRIVALVKAFLKAGIMAADGQTRDSITGTPQGGIASPLLANIALSVLDEHFCAKWDAHGGEHQRRAHRRRGGATYRIVRYADDFVIMVCGAQEHADALWDEVAEVLAPLGLRLSPSKTRVCHIDDGFDFLGFHIQRRTKKGTANKYVYTYPSKKALASIMDKVRTLTARSRHRTLADLLHRLNPVLRGWCNYFRFGVSSATFGYLDKFVWRRITGWLRKRHKGINWRSLYRRFLTGPPRGVPAEGEEILLRAQQVKTQRYRWRGTRIPAPWTSGATAPAAA
jgi:RNA-directed DNA polymerase